jgi:hypothetical protein
MGKEMGVDQALCRATLQRCHELKADSSAWSSAVIMSAGVQRIRSTRAIGTPIWQLKAGGARFVRRISPKPTTYLTGEDLYQIAAIKFEEAAATPEGPARQQVLNSAYNFRDLAKMKGWPPSDVKPPE